MDEILCVIGIVFITPMRTVNEAIPNRLTSQR